MASVNGALPNVYYHRRVLAAASKPCFICYKPTTSVLITPDNRDFFYTCQGHLTDRGFAQPVGDAAEDAAAKRKREELEREIEIVKKEYEEKLEKKKKKKKEAKKDKDKKKEDDGKTDKDDDVKDEKDRDDKIKALEKGDASSAPNIEEGPRIFALHKSIYQMRVARLQNAQAAKRNQQRAINPITLPSVPLGKP